MYLLLHLFAKCALPLACRVWNDEGQAITRQYTPVSPLDQTDWFEVIIKVGWFYICIFLFSVATVAAISRS